MKARSNQPCIDLIYQIRRKSCWSSCDLVSIVVPFSPFLLASSRLPAAVSASEVLLHPLTIKIKMQLMGCVLLLPGCAQSIVGKIP